MGKALVTLPYEEQEILQKRYWKEATLREVGESMDLSTEQVRSLSSSALRRLRQSRTAKPLKAFVEERTNYYRRVSLDAFQRHGNSAVELEVMKRGRFMWDYLEERRCRE